jgi:translation elongation factor P/translation initiation factor 5A
MIDVNELRKGVTFEMDGALYKVLDYSHNKRDAATPPSASRRAI